MGFDIITGDCLQVLRDMPANSVDAAITDPPYNVGIDYGAATNDDQSPEDYAGWCRAWFAELQRVVKGPIAISVGQANLSQWAAIAPPTWWLAWWKPAAMGRCVVGFNNWEPIALYGKPVGQVCDVIRAPIVTDNEIKWHPCPKPREWAIKQIEMLTYPGAIVLDPFAGSGTTGVGCILSGRQFIGIESNREFAQKALARIDRAARAQPTLFGTPQAKGVPEQLPIFGGD